MKTSAVIYLVVVLGNQPPQLHPEQPVHESVDACTAVAGEWVQQQEPSSVRGAFCFEEEAIETWWNKRQTEGVVEHRS